MRENKSKKLKVRIKRMTVRMKIDDRVRFVSKNEVKSRVKTMLLSMAFHN